MQNNLAGHVKNPVLARSLDFELHGMRRMLIDLHAYTDVTGGPTLKNLLKAAAAEGLDAVCIADPQASAAAAKAALEYEGDVKLFVGVELPTRAGDVILIVPELDPFMTREEWRQLVALGVPALEEVVELAEANGGVVLLVHPYDRRRKLAPRDRVFALEGIAGVECANSTAELGFSVFAIESLAKGPHNVFAGSATVSSKNRGSRWATLMAGDAGDEASLIEGLKAGEFWPVELNAAESRRQERPPRDRGERGDRGGRGGRGDRGDRGERGRGPRPGGGGRRRSGRDGR